MSAHALSVGEAKFDTPKPSNRFRWNLEYITTSGMWPHTQIHMALRQHGWSGWIASLPRLGFFPCLFCYLLSSTHSTVGLILMVYTSYNVFLPMDVPFEGLVGIAHYLQGQIPKNLPKRCLIRCFSANRQKIKNILSPQLFNISRWCNSAPYQKLKIGIFKNWVWAIMHWSIMHWFCLYFENF